MANRVTIAIDAMGGENSPNKIFDAIKISLKKNKNNYFHLFGKENLLKDTIQKNKEISDYCKIINCEDVIGDEESPFTAAKKGKNTSMWKSIESQKNGGADISLSAGNTGVLLVISKMILKMINGVSIQYPNAEKSVLLKPEYESKKFECVKQDS